VIALVHGEPADVVQPASGPSVISSVNLSESITKVIRLDAKPRLVKR